MYKCNIFPDKEKAKELLRAEIGRQYCNKFFYLESSLKEKEPEERKQQRAVLEQQRQTQLHVRISLQKPSARH